MRRTLIVCAALALCPSFALAQPGQLPITTPSPAARALYEKALDCVDNLENDAARPLLDEAIQADPEFAMAYALRASTGGGYKVTRQNLARAVSLADKVSPGERHLILAMQAVADGSLPKMKEHVAELLKLHSGDKHVLYTVGNMMRSVDPDEALALYTRATTIDPSFAAPYNQIGYLHLRKDDFARAEQAMKQYIATRPDSPNPYDSYAELLLRMGRYDESIAQYERALTKAPAFAASLAGIGHNYVFKGDGAKARASYERLRGSANVQDRMAGLYWRAVSFVHEGKVAEALEALDQQRELATSAGLGPAAMNTHLDQARLLSESRRATDARAHLDQAQSMIGGESFPESYRDYWRRHIGLVRATVAAQAGDFATARLTLERLGAEATPDLPAGFTQLFEGTAGIVDVLEGKYDAALSHLKAARPEDPVAMFYHAEALRLKGDAAGAAALYKKVATWNTNGLSYALVRSRALKRLET